MQRCLATRDEPRGRGNVLTCSSWYAQEKAVLACVGDVACCGKPSYVQLSPLCLLSTLDITHVIKFTRLSPLIVHAGQRSRYKLAFTGESLETRLYKHTMYLFLSPPPLLFCFLLCLQFAASLREGRGRIR